ncbi:UNKNOWN [Stylonychia lemnae]|uniref:Uncharacterized protein n=1 Tax=Stylonychia lemnae TaxID=5949 RepID=A0A078B5R2_STYLE|nr:UNKNOWN [Stylonychia lemnae]|eukprot:CDW88853.1 UNKNOWN [Stylonychia lemnae]
MKKYICAAGVLFLSDVFCKQQANSFGKSELKTDKSIVKHKLLSIINDLDNQIEQVVEDLKKVSNLEKTLTRRSASVPKKVQSLFQDDEIEVESAPFRIWFEGSDALIGRPQYKIGKENDKYVVYPSDVQANKYQSLLDQQKYTYGFGDCSKGPCVQSMMARQNFPRINDGMIHLADCSKGPCVQSSLPLKHSQWADDRVIRIADCSKGPCVQSMMPRYNDGMIHLADCSKGPCVQKHDAKIQ